MKVSKRILLAALLAWIPAAACAQESAGRVLVAVGDVAIVRGAQRIAAAAGTEVRAGDTLELGSQSNAQVRFTDESIVALRSDTSFRISEYAFRDKEPEAQRAFFNLIKGGMRTVTGLIGRRHRQNYGVQTLVATIGIRGTHYALCHDCRNPDGSIEQGTLGAVTVGRLGVTNETGEHQFGVDQYFQVTTAAAPPETLLVPPPALRDALEGRVRAKQRADQVAASAQEKQAAAAAVASAIAGAVAPGVDVSVASSIINATTAAALMTNVFQVTNQAATSIEGFADILQPTLTGTVFYRLVGPFNIPTSCTNPPCGAAVAGEINVAVNLALQRATASLAIQLDNGETFNASVPISVSGVPITLNGNQVTFSGTFNLADFPNNRGSFDCSHCGPATVSRPQGTPGSLSQISFSGTISGAQATVTFAGTNVDAGGGGAGSISATLPLQAPTSGAAAAIAMPRLAVNNPNPNNTVGTDTAGAAFFNVEVDGAGRLTRLGPVVGRERGVVGGAVNTIVGAAPSAGNLVWGTWTNGNSAATKATITDGNYNTFNPANNSVQPWITGLAANSLPPSLGTLTYTPIGSVFSSVNGRLNNASLTADFVNRSLSLSINATNIAAGNTFQMNHKTGFNPANSRFAGGFSAITCSGPCVGGSPSGSFNGFFAGPQAEGAGLAFSAGFGAGTGVTGAIAFKR